MPNSQHLLLRNGTWYYRRRVPKAFQAEHGSIIQRSLGTSDKKEAIKKRELLDVEWRQRFEAEVAPLASNCAKARARTPLTEGQAERLAQDFVARSDARRRTHYESKPLRSPAERDELIDILNLDLAVAEGSCRYDHAGHLDRQVSQLLEADGFGIDDQIYSGEAFAKLVRRSLMEIGRRALARVKDEHEQSFFDRLFDPAKPKPMTVRELAIQYIRYVEEDARAHDLSEKHLDRTKASLSLIQEMLGDATLVSDVDYARCRAFCSQLARVPANRTKIYRDLPLTVAIERAEGEGRDGLSANTQQQYLGTLKALLDLAVNLDLLRSNPATNLRPLTRQKHAARDQRLPFTAEQLRTFFSSDFYRSCAVGGEAPYRRASRDWRFWLPLISLFMGMRPKEILQLHLDDIRQTGAGTWFLSVEPTDDGEENESIRKTTKTKASRRSVPLHPELEKLGFLMFVEDQRRSSDDPLLFRGLKRNKYGDPAAYPLRYLRERLSKEMAMTDRQAFYSFRHTWRDAVRAVDAPADFVQAVGAWEGATTTSDNYGSLAHPDRHYPVMCRLSFESLDITHLYVEACDAINCKNLV